jgi:hypothetical protein
LQLAKRTARNFSRLLTRKKCFLHQLRFYKGSYNTHMFLLNTMVHQAT